MREALVNSLIHADYFGQGGVVIEKYPDRFEFSNPGLMLISFDQMRHGNISECRNKTLQTMFSLIGAGEKAGSGIDKIMEGWKSQHWRFPSLHEQTRPDRVKWILPLTNLIPEDSLKRLEKHFGKRFKKFDQTEIQILVTADVEGEVTNSRMREITEGHDSDLTKTLQSLVSQGTLEQQGQGRWTKYRLPDLQRYGDNLAYKQNNSVPLESNSVPLESNSVPLSVAKDQQLEELADLFKESLARKKQPVRIAISR